MSFRREAHVPRGGPDGGDGGRGGDVVLVCDASLRDLQRFRRPGAHDAGRGGHGQGALRHGARGADLLVAVPPGTEAVGEEGALAGRRCDLVVPGSRVCIARGGSGGRGNKRFAHATRQAPHFAQRGLAGEEGWLSLQLKLIADVGLVGLPNAGKSSLLSRLTRAAPKVADYPFTTLSPVLGTLDADDRQLVLADIPGLIEGASEGAGLGHDFLAHIERTRLLVHVVDVAPVDGSEPERNFSLVESELAAHDPRLAGLPRVIALSKVDLLAREDVASVQARWQERHAVGVVALSSATGVGLDRLSTLLLELVEAAPLSVGAPDEDLPEHVVFRPSSGRAFAVTRQGEARFLVEGAGVERVVRRYDVDNEEAMAHLEGTLRRIGVLRALHDAGFRAGDEIEIAGTVFELDPEDGGAS